MSINLKSKSTDKVPLSLFKISFLLYTGKSETKEVYLPYHDLKKTSVIGETSNC